jgi:cell division protein FtsW
MSTMAAMAPSGLMARLKQRMNGWFGEPPEAGIDALPVRVHGTEFTRTAASPVHVKGFDQPLVWVTFAL